LCGSRPPFPEIAWELLIGVGSRSRSAIASTWVTTFRRRWRYQGDGLRTAHDRWTPEAGESLSASASSHWRSRSSWRGT
jgi:hypothetical protein